MQWYIINNVSEVDSPALVVYPKRVKKNIELIKTMIDDVNRLRPHVKTHKTKEAVVMMLEAGIRKFKCATIAEAEMLGSVNAPDVLLAYQPVGPKLRRFIFLIKNYPATKFSFLIDHITVADQISTEASQSEITFSVFIDLNVGMNRTGIDPEHAIELYQYASKLHGINVKGFHVYDGHIHDEDLQLRTKRADEIFERIEVLKKELSEKGFPEPVIIAGGSPTFPVYAKKENIECSPGTFVYWDAGYEKSFREQPFLPAAILITRIISLPDPITICTDLGHKSVASENPLDKRLRFLNADDLKITGQNEEHLMLEASKDHSYKIGDVLYALPYHVCPTCALYERAIIVEDGNTSGEWRITGRDRKINY